MKYRYFLPFFIGCTLFFSNNSSAQLVGDNAFLQGQFLEACIAPNGSWGNTMPVPAGYTTRGSSSLTYSDPLTGVTATGDGIDFSYDQGHDGWSLGTPPWYGSFFLPGTPFDGWSVQIDDTMSSAFYTDGGFDTSLGGIFGGTVTGYTGPTCSNPYAAKAGTWQGTVGLHRAGLRNAMQIVQVNEVDTTASWLIVTTKFYNTTDSTLPAVYYMATADPDNDVTVGGSFPTNNHIAYQGGPFDRHEVWARPPAIDQDAFTGLATQDCRAKVLIYTSWPPTMTTGNDLDKVWAGTAGAMCPCYYPLGSTTLDQDIAYGLVFNIGNIAPHDSAFISYAWIFSDTSAVDSIFTVSPGISTLGNVYSPSQPDSVFGCNLFGCGVSGKTFTADIINGENRKWAFSKWSWAPATGLSVTTGRHVIVDFSLITAPTTYTITGTPDVTRGSCTPPAPVTFTIYVQPCFSASGNKPCDGDTLVLTGTGDTTGATFFWSGPGGFTSTGQSTYRFPTTLADTGVYRLIKIVGTDQDTTYTDVQIRPLPIVKASTSIICSGNTLSLAATPDSVGETFSWTGPNGFTSGVQNPGIPLAPVSDTGMYRVVATWNGCNDTAYVDAKIDSTPAVPTASSDVPAVCSQTSTLLLKSNDKTPGISYYRWSGPGGIITSSLQNPVFTDLATVDSGVYTVTAYIVYTGPALICSNSVAITVAVDSTPLVPVLTSNGPVCSGLPMDLTAKSSAGVTYDWSGPDAFSSSMQNPIINPAYTGTQGIYSVTATKAYLGLSCTSSPAATIFVVVDSTPIQPTASSNSPGAPGVSICQSDTLKLFASDTTPGVSYIWAGPGSFASPLQNPEIINVIPAATGQYTVTATLGTACTASAVITVSITPTPPLTATSNSPVCSGDTLALQASSDPGATFSWTGPFTFMSSLQNPTRVPAVMEYTGIYHVRAIVSNCPSALVNDTVVINQTPPAPWVKWMTLCQNYDAYPLQAYGENILWYKSAAQPLAGTPVPPIPATSQLGIAYYYATQTVDGCISAVDSIQITVYPTPVLTVAPSVGICPHDSAILKATSTSEIAYFHWFPALYLGDTSTGTVIARPENDITYTVVVSNEFGCADTGHVSVTVNSNAVITLPLSATIYPGETYQISPQTNCSYFSWFPPQGLDHDNISNPVASPEVSTKYTVQGTTAWGCTVNDSIDIIVDPNSLLAVPNAFTPGNGPNNEFKIIVQGKATLTSFNIFDRWGVLVFTTTDINAGWDGTYKGTPQLFGVYVYEISAVTSTGQPFIKKGNLTLVR